MTESAPRFTAPSIFNVGGEAPVEAPAVAAPGLPVTAPVAPVASASPGIPLTAPVTPSAAPATPFVDAPVVAVAPPAAPVAPVTHAPAPVAPVAPVAPAPVAPVTPPAAPVAPVAHAPAPAAPVADAPVAAPAASAPGMQAVTDDQEERIVLDDLLIHMVETGGSDLHLSAGSPPMVRIRGEMEQVPGFGPLTPNSLQSTMYAVMTNKQRATFEQDWELDFAYTVPGKARFRVNVMKQRGSVGAVMRTIPWEILSLEALGLPDTIGSFADLPRGLVLVTGPTGSGKSTTLASIIDKINRTKRGHIITIEDPVEFLHQHRGCVVNQREIGEDTHSFKDALKHVLRQDPDVILIGELRDLETISTALTAAETGHLVFATLHTQSAQETITRIIDVFPPEQQQQVRTQLSASLQGVVCQTLCRTADGKGRQAAVEIMVGTPAIRALVREGKLQQVQSALQAGAKDGMQTLNQDLANHVLAGRISYDAGLEKCSDRADFETLTGGREAAEAAARRVTNRQPGMGSLGSL